MSQDRNRSKREARRILEQFAVKSPPVPVDRIAKGLGAIIQYAPLDEELSGMVYVKDGRPIIGVNSLHHPNRQRFTIAHEIGHIVLHREYISTQVHVDKTFTLFRDPTAASGTDLWEIHANAFAAELLMPEEWVKAELSRIELDDEAALVAAARRFKVSKAAIQNRFINMF